MRKSFEFNSVEASASFVMNGSTDSSKKSGNGKPAKVCHLDPKRKLNSLNFRNE